MSPLRPLATALTSVLVGVLLLGAPDAALAALGKPAAPVVVKPTKLPRGADVAVPHVEGTTVVDGGTRIPVTLSGVNRLQLLGRSGSAYVVTAFDDQSGRRRVLRVTPGAITTLVTPSARGDVVVMSADGTRFAQSVPRKGFSKSRVQVWDASTGAPVTAKGFRGLATVLDLDASVVVLSAGESTVSWSTASGTVAVLAKRRGYRADLEADRLAFFDADPFDGGCTVVTRLSAPTARLWRSCSERVETFSPSGARMATVDLLSDGIGPSQVLVRGAGGASRGVYRIRGYFGELTWESDKTLLLESFGRKKFATVRCVALTCVRATALAPTPAF